MNAKVLSVGINKFPNFSQNNLRGCVNDVENLTKLLTDNLGFSYNYIFKLKDEMATKSNIMENLKSLVKDAINGNCSYIVFHLSTHGTRMEINNVMVDAFIPSDIAAINGDWDRNHIIIADELSDIISSLPPSVLFEAIIDTCHSGSGIKDFDLQPDRKIKFMAPPMDYARSKDRESKSVRSFQQSISSRAVINHISWAGCQDDQTSADANINGQWNGAFTYYLCEQVRNLGSSMSRDTLLGQVLKSLSGKYSQIPQLNCSDQYKPYPFGSGPIPQAPPFQAPPFQAPPFQAPPFQAPPFIQSKDGDVLVSNQMVSLLPAMIQVLYSVYKTTSSSPSRTIPPIDIHAEGKANEDHKEPASSVTQVVSINTDKTQYTRGENVIVNVTNNTGKPLFFPSTSKGVTITNDRGQIVYPSKPVFDDQTMSLDMGNTFAIPLQFNETGKYTIIFSPTNSPAARITINII